PGARPRRCRLRRRLWLAVSRRRGRPQELRIPGHFALDVATVSDFRRPPWRSLEDLFIVSFCGLSPPGTRRAPAKSTPSDVLCLGAATYGTLRRGQLKACAPNRPALISLGRAILHRS